MSTTSQMSEEFVFQNLNLMPKIPLRLSSDIESRPLYNNNFSSRQKENQQGFRPPKTFLVRGTEVDAKMKILRAASISAQCKKLAATVKVTWLRLTFIACQQSCIFKVYVRHA
ncbi:hypothetical protein GcM3_060013 [Golovinomyces cichoracearum]|uniref:Uncharacterized protein n=1 Tax=Golovinomyces cichoracearum TaxID=62708 RepID=A0A420IWE9_9PEZI|nr:hypothetical protein GcM3_060013 [Golovinomyces cichoracearum]